MSGFSRNRRSGAAVATFTAFEADLLRSLAAQLIELLRSEEAAPSGTDDDLAALLDFSGPTTEPEDPVLVRLFPNAYTEDPEASGDFRRFTETGMRKGKADAASTIIDILEDSGLTDRPADGEVIDVELDEETARIWMRSFTDMRLAIGTRLEVAEDDEDYWAALPDDDPRTAVHQIYHWLGYLQETLIDAISL